MSVLLTKEDGSVTKHSTSSNNIREKSPRPKSQSRSLANNRDSVKIVNEKNSNNIKVIRKSFFLSINLFHMMSVQLQDPDDDSDAEKLSPLLNPDKNENFNNNNHHGSALHIDGVDESIDDTDTDVEDQKVEVSRKNMMRIGWVLIRSKRN